MQKLICGATALVVLLLFSGVPFAAGTDSESPLESPLRMTPCSLVLRAEPPLRQVELVYRSERKIESVTVKLSCDGKPYSETVWKGIVAGNNERVVFMPYSDKPVKTSWQLLDSNGKTVAERTATVEPPRRWTFYLLSSSHVDIGLHKAQYKQRKMTADYVDAVAKLVDETAQWPDDARYRYHIEGTWFWSNYPRDHGEAKADTFIDRYVKKDIVSIGATQAGNHTQTYGFEELCRATYYKKELLDRWKIDRDTMIMADNNGISWSIVTPFVDAGIKNILWLPNRWNPKSVGGARTDVKWDSKVPTLFWWKGADGKSKMLFWALDHYGNSAAPLGLGGYNRPIPPLENVAKAMAKQLALMEAKVPYDVWLWSKYYDDEAPNTGNADFVCRWNEKWQWPRFVTCGNPSLAFEAVRARFGDKIPTLSGDIVCGWAQHPICAPELLAQKMEADRLLPTAEKLAALAQCVDPDYIYPRLRLRRAWDGLLANDEHSYGTSGYKGRDVYETWLQHRDWIAKAKSTAEDEIDRAIRALAEKVKTTGPAILAFNPTLVPRSETIMVPLPDGGTRKVRTPVVPSFGYATFPVPESKPVKTEKRGKNAPTMENEYYRVAMASDGGVVSIYDKELGRELLDPKAVYKANQFIYTKDNHKSFTVPQDATFEFTDDGFGRTVTVRMNDRVTKAEVIQKITLPNDAKRIEFDNRLNHVHDLFNRTRYNRFGYFAFPFDVPKYEFYASLNGVVARPKIDSTHHTTDSYTAVREWSSVGNGDFTIGLFQLDSNLVEFGKIHADKKECGVPAASSHIYPYVVTDWLQMHTNGGSAINLRFRFAVTSGKGSWRALELPALAERWATPLVATFIPRKQDGACPPSASFLALPRKSLRLLAFKAGEDPGRGLILRLHETCGEAVEVALDRPVSKDEPYRFLSDCPLNAIRKSPLSENARGENARGENAEKGRDGGTITLCSVTEQDRGKCDGRFTLDPFGCATVRLRKTAAPLDAPQVAVESVTDRSITLGWPAVKNARRYHVYRSEPASCPADVYHLIGTTNGPKFTDPYLSPGATWHYRVAAVDRGMNQGKVSDVADGTTNASGDSAPAKVGVIEDGLVSVPRAVHGDEFDQLYLEWRANPESDVTRYELHRSEKPGFTPDKMTSVADVPPGPYKIVTYEDRGVKKFTTYYYRVRAVDRDGHKGPWSDEFSGTTREDYKTEK